MSWSKLLLLVPGLLVAAASAAADPLDYTLQRAGLVRLLADSVVVVTYTPPLGLGEPTTKYLIGNTDLTGSPSGSAVADVGLPDQFAGGANGLLLSAFDAHVEFEDFSALLTNLFDDIVPLLPAPPPIPLAGAALLVDVATLDVNLLGPLDSSLVSLDDPNTYYWGGVAPLAIDGNLNLLIAIPGQEPIQFASAHFGLDSSQGALAGSFDGDATMTRIVVGLDDASLNPDTSGLVQPYVLDLAPLGAISVTVQRLRLVANASMRGVNQEYGLPGGAAAPLGCGIGPELAALLPALAWLRRRRSA
jgi:hypothetical protein